MTILQRFSQACLSTQRRSHVYDGFQLLSVTFACSVVLLTVQLDLSFHRPFNVSPLPFLFLITGGAENAHRDIL